MRLDPFELAGALFGSSRAEDGGASLGDRTIHGIAKKSEDGSAMVVVEGDVTLPDGEEGPYVKLPSEAAVDDGDNVTISLSGGRLSTPVVRGAVGAGDRVRQLASAARAIADAINQHFWTDDNGVHVSTEENNPTGAQNVLLNALGMLFRAGSNNLLALVTGSNPGVQIYDGAGNANTNVAASMSADGVMLGQAGRSQTSLAPDGIRMTNPQHMTTFELAEGGKISTEVSENFAQDLSWSDLAFSFSDAIAPGATIRVDLTGGMTDDGPLA